jgi:hypothetical protein
MNLSRLAWGQVLINGEVSERGNFVNPACEPHFEKDQQESCLPAALGFRRCIASGTV